MLAKAHINTKDLIRRAITVVVIWIDLIPRYNGKRFANREE